MCWRKAGRGPGGAALAVRAGVAEQATLKPALKGAGPRRGCDGRASDKSRSRERIQSDLR